MSNAQLLQPAERPFDWTHLVPAFPPPFEGVGSYAQALAGTLAAMHGQTGRFLVGDPAWRRGAETGGAEVVSLPARSPEALFRLLERDVPAGTILLHYANYGFDPHGCPDWLIAGVEAWRQGAAGRLLVAFFHEVAASGPPWRRSFWQRRHQLRLAARLARRSDHLATSLPVYRELLAPWAGERGIAVLPVPSTVGEPADAPPFEDRPKRLALFGGPGVRGRAYGPYRDELLAACRAFEIEEICDIGPPPCAPESLGAIPVRSLGPLSPSEVQEVLLSARVGFLAYPPAFLPKSTIFAAYAACGLLAVCAWKGAAPASELAAGHHYWMPPAGRLAPSEIERIRSAASAWYRGHDLGHQARWFAGLLRGEAAA